MQSEEHAHNVSAEVGAIAEPLPHPTDAEPLVQTSPHVSQRRLTTRELSRRRRQRLLELLQQQAKPSVRSWGGATGSLPLEEKRARPRAAPQSGECSGCVRKPVIATIVQ